MAGPSDETVEYEVKKMLLDGDGRLGGFSGTLVDVSSGSYDTIGREIRIQIQVSVAGNSSPENSSIWVVGLGVSVCFTMRR